MKNNFSKQWDAGGGSRSIIQSLNLFTSRNLFKSLKSILMVVALLSLSSNVWGASTPGTGYTKITSISSLADGDEVILFCDDEGSGVTGYSSSDATVSSTSGDWIKFVVEKNETNYYFKDPGTKKYITKQTSNKFTITATTASGNECTVNSNGVLCINSRYLCKNGNYYRMYTSVGSYKGIFVYKAPSATPVTTLYLWEAGVQSANLKGTYKVGDKYTLPEETDAECGDKVLVGWSTVEIQTPGAKPTSNYYEPGDEVTLAANNNFYAVFADANEGGGEASYKVTTTLTKGETYIFGAVKAAASSTLANNTTFGAVAFTNTYNSSSPNWGQRVDLTPDANGKIAATNTSITNECKWVLESIDDGNYKFKKGTNYLYLGTSAGSISGAQSGISTTGNCYIENVNSTCKDAFLLHPSSSSTNIMLYNTSNGYRMYASRSYSATMAPYVRFYEYNPGVTYSNYTTTCGQSTYTVLFLELKLPNFYGIFLSHFFSIR